MFIDLRSDTVTKPTDGMRRIMADAEVGDDVFSEDPTVRRLEERMADLFGHQAALFVPSGTMGNQLCLATHTIPGCEIIADETAHIFNYETGAAAHLSSAQIRTVKAPNGILTPELVEPLIRSMNDWDPITRVIEIENTANKAGGTFYSVDQIAVLRKLADKYHLGFHIDGARIWNAHVASGISFKTFGAFAQTLSVCFSKGLGAPVGSIVIGDKDRVKKMRRLRKMWGGGMRQVGVLAAAAEYAFDHHLELLAFDHDRAKKFGSAIAENPAFGLDINKVQSNIVIFECKKQSAKEVCDYFWDKGILMSAFSATHVRAVFHFQIDDSMLKKAILAIQSYSA